MSGSSHIVRALVVVALGLVLAGSASASPSASIEQVRNGVATAPTTPIPSWGTGNAGGSNSHYLESHSTAYRAVMGDLPTDGTVIELIVGYDVKRSGSYALDYLTQYQRLLPHVLFGHKQPEVFDPLNGVSGVGPVVTTAPIPMPTQNLVVDPDGTDPDPAAPQPATSWQSLSSPEKVMTLFGGTLIDVTYVTQADVSLNTKSSETRVRVRFTANSPTAVLAWGGHIACRWDWGFNADGTPRSAGGISGSSYHMRLVTWNLGSLGSQDRSMSTDAVYPVPRCGIGNVGPFCAGSTNTHTAPAGMESYQWSLVDNTAGATIVGSDTSLSVVVRSSTSGSYRVVVTTGASGFSRQCDATVTVNAPATADAGADIAVCASTPQVQLAGIVGGGNASWTGGTGTFSPSRSAANALYTPSATEITAGSVTLTLTSTPASGPCPTASDQVKITIQKAATANAGADQILCATSPQAHLAGVVGGSAVSGSWSGGAGTFSPSAAALNAVYTPTADEIAAGGVTLTLTTDVTSGPCAAVSDQVRITINPAATADAGADLTVCATSPQAQLAGLIGGGAASGSWSGGTGTYSPNASALNAVYTPSAAEITAGGVTLTLTSNDPAGPCAAATDQVRITINRAATVNAGADQTLCSSTPQVQLAGVLGGSATGGTWSGGAGTFSPDASAPNAVYTPTAAEITAGTVTLTFTTDDPTGPCGAVSDQMMVTFLPAATVNAGSDLTVCSSSPQAHLAGVIGGGATGGTWSGGTGTYSPSASALNAVYTPSAQEIAAGGVTLTLTTNDPAGPCVAATDQVRITINPAATANAGVDQTVCSSTPQAQLAAAFGGGASGGTWTGGSGSFSPSASSPTAIYTASAGEIAAGTVTLTFTTNDPQGPCGAMSDQMVVTILPAATVNAGTDQRLCASSPVVHLAGSVGGGAASGTWSGGAGTFSPKNTNLGATYTPTAAEIAAGSVTLTLTTDDPTGPCAALNDQVRITFDPITTVDAGLDQAVCSSSPQVLLHGTVSGTVTSGTWSGGTGFFTPNANSLNATYTPSASEIAAGRVTLTLTSAASAGPCPPASDQMTITISPAVGVNAGPDQIVCLVSPQVQLSGALLNGATSAVWSGGTGTFSPNNTTLNAIYTPSAAELAARSVTLTLTSNDPPGPCPAVSDQMKITIDAPTVTVTSRTVCNGIAPVSLCANVSGGVSPYTYLWSTGATGQCISVSVPGPYTVTITDARGCQATGTGRFDWRDCTGQLAHTSTTCGSFMDGSFDDLVSADVNYGIRDGVISTISPGVFFYFTLVRAPSADFTIDVVQTKDNPAFPFCDVLHDQVSEFDGNCSPLATGVETSPGQSSVVVTGATVGKVFILSVKYTLKNLIGTPMPDSIGVHYDFMTQINGLTVDKDPEGLQIGKPWNPAPSSSDTVMLPSPIQRKSPVLGGVADVENVALYRPMPNPFSDGMRMAYSVATDGERVSIHVYDVSGRLVRSLADGAQAAGNHMVAWDGHDDQGVRMHQGVYFVHAVIGRQVKQVRVTYLK